MYFSTEISMFVAAMSLCRLVEAIALFPRSRVESNTASQGDLLTRASEEETQPFCLNEQNHQPPFPIQRAYGPFDQGWMSIGCSIPEIVNTAGAYTKEQRWYAADATNALKRAYVCYEGIRASQLPSKDWSFSRAASNFFHGVDGLQCEIIDWSGGATSRCASPVDCSEEGHAAGFQILNSLVEVHNLNQGIKDEMMAMLSNVTDRIGTFSSTFSPVEDKLKDLKILLDIIGLGFAVAAAPIWNAVLRKAMSPETLGTVKDTVNGLVSNGISLGKDAATLAGSAIKTQNSLSEKADLIVGAWVQLHNAANFALFQGSDYETSGAPLFNMINDGAMLDYSTTADNRETRSATIQKSLWATLLPIAWGMSNKDLYPFIMTPDEIDPSKGCEGYDVSYYLRDRDAGPALACYDNRPWWLVAAGKPGTGFVCPAEGTSCIDLTFEPLPGMGDLKFGGDNKWGGLNLGHLITGSVNSFRANGNKNGYKAALDDQNTLWDMAENGVIAAGVINFPICSGKEASENWIKGSNDNPNYPCNA